jgi:hypothetical protein
MRAAFKLPSRTKNARVSAEHSWRSFANRTDMTRPLLRVRACVAIGRRRQDWLAVGAIVGNASSRRLRQARQCLGFAAKRGRGERDVRGSNRILSSPGPARLEPAQRRTLEVGTCVVLSSLGVGFQLGSWPAWTFLAGIGVYLAWVVLYAEVTVQTKRRPALWQRWRWHGRRRSRGPASVGPASGSTAQPAQENRTA